MQVELAFTSGDDTEFILKIFFKMVNCKSNESIF